jgi:two-component system OmpR family sensor kinase
MSLRARLLLVTVGLVTLGLLIADVVTYRALEASLSARVDDQIKQTEALAIGGALHLQPQSWPNEPPPGPLTGFGPPSGSYAAVLDGTGRVLDSAVFPEGDAPTPVLPAGLPGSVDAGTGVAHFSAASDGGPDFRVEAIGPEAGRGTLVIAIPLTEMRATLGRLLAIEALVTLGVALAAGAIALWLVRLGLRPLATMGDTAGAIAAGDLSRRVEPADDRTEIGKLGTSLNAMLAQIEAAFEERRASEARLRRFVADASHELRTPLTSIRGYAELFRRGAGERPEDLATSMARIEAEASRMGVLVDDLLLLARLDQGRQLEREQVDVSRVVADAADAAHVIEPGRTIELTTTTPNATVPGDPGRLRQVVDNLLENARVHTPAGTTTRVRVESQDGAVLLTIADDGPGMDPEVAARAFERFYRGDPARARSTGGVGLGLSIVSAIVHAHGGAVRVVDGSPGTAIEVVLPVTPRREPDRPPPPPSPDPRPS